MNTTDLQDRMEVDRKFLVLIVCLFSFLPARVFANVTCNANYIGTNAVTSSLFKNYVLKNNSEQAIGDTSGKVTLTGVKDSKGNDYELYLAGWTNQNESFISVRRICHNDWNCSFSLGQASSDGKILRLEVDNLVEDDISNVVVECQANK